MKSGHELWSFGRIPAREAATRWVFLDSEEWLVTLDC